MPYYILILLIEVACIAHIMRTGRERFWVYIVLFLPMAGMLAYLAVEVLPDLLGSRTANRLNRKATSVLDPERGLRSRLAALERTDTAENRRLLAEEHIARGEFAEAVNLYEASLVGVHADDVALLMGLARAKIGTQDYAGALAALDRLRVAHPKFQSSEGHLIYARCLEGLGRDDEAESEYAALVAYAPGEEVRCRYGQLLMRRGRSVEARSIFAQILKYAGQGSRRYRRDQQVWIEAAERALGGN
jgi:hypothetical protein